MSDLIAKFQHIRLVVLYVEAHAPNGPILMYSDPMPMHPHEWRKAREEGFGVEVLPNGGWTACNLFEEHSDGLKPVAFGQVQCSNDDNYVKETGRIKSRGKALSDLKAKS
jgi:hypothetical protein